jgi:hypothetical protein
VSQPDTSARWVRIPGLVESGRVNIDFPAALVDEDETPWSSTCDLLQAFRLQHVAQISDSVLTITIEVAVWAGLLAGQRVNAPTAIKPRFDRESPQASDDLDDVVDRHMTLGHDEHTRIFPRFADTRLVQIARAS